MMLNRQIKRVMYDTILLLCLAATPACFRPSNQVAEQPSVSPSLAIDYTSPLSGTPDPPLPSTLDSKTLVRLSGPYRDGFVPYLTPSKIEKEKDTTKIWLVVIKEEGAGRPNLLSQIEVDCTEKRVKQLVSQELDFSQEKSGYYPTELQFNRNPKWNEKENLVKLIPTICQYLEETRYDN